MSAAEPGTVIPGPVAIQPAWLAQPAHAPDRRRFSVLCHRGWCDNEFRDQAINALIEGLSGAKAPVTRLPADSCPFPERCDHECHDAELGWPRRPAGTSP